MPKRDRANAESLAALATRVCERDGPVRLTGLRGSARAVVGAELVRAHRERAVLFLCASAKAGDALLADLRCALGEPIDGRGPGAGRTRTFPRHDTLPYDRFSPQPFIVTQRTACLHLWLECTSSAQAPVVVAPWTALALRVPARAAFRGRSVRLEAGASIDRDELVARLVTAGYAHMPLVEERGELAVRGGIVDIFPPHFANPVRLELLGDEIESLREFDAASQRSQAKLDSVWVPPPRELLFDRDEIVERADAI
ncbi:MAG: hypothetical protein O7A09_08425, partial [Proteobacteria bacterium]|nr:hypothetical protein [Pseudomonadota bacterium]